jgi:hypothetical protein
VAEELQRRWRERCAQLHSSHDRPLPLVTCSQWNSADTVDEKMLVRRLTEAASGSPRPRLL